MNDCEVGKLEDMIEWIDEGGFVVNVFDVEPLDAIKSATYWPSFFMGVSDTVGTISVGKQADIIAVKGNVLKHISTLQNIDIVMKKGKIYKNTKS